MMDILVFNDLIRHGVKRVIIFTFTLNGTKDGMFHPYLITYPSKTVLRVYFIRKLYTIDYNKDFVYLNYYALDHPFLTSGSGLDCM